MINTFGHIVLWVIAVVLVSALPIAELARGMATNPSQYKVSRNAAIISTLGVIMAVWLFMYC